MKKFLAPVVLALALTTSGAAFAAQADDGLHLSVYSETPELTYDNAMTVASLAGGARCAVREPGADDRHQWTGHAGQRNRFPAHPAGITFSAPIVSGDKADGRVISRPFAICAVVLQARVENGLALLPRQFTFHISNTCPSRNLTAAWSRSARRSCCVRSR